MKPTVKSHKEKSVWYISCS